MERPGAQNSVVIDSYPRFILALLKSRPSPRLSRDITLVVEVAASSSKYSRSCWKFKLEVDFGTVVGNLRGPFWLVLTQNQVLELPVCL